MRFWKSKKEFAALVPKPTGGSVSLYRGQFVEGDYFAKFSFLEEVPEGDVDKEKVLFSQTGISNQAKGVFLNATPNTTPPVETTPTEPAKAPETTDEVKTEGEDAKDDSAAKKKTGVKKNG